jgi:hypothetical protein
MEVNGAQKQVEGRVEVIALFWRSVLLSVRIGLRSCCAVPCVRDGRLAQAVLDAKPAKVRLTPQIGTAYRTTLARLHQTLISGGQPEAVDAARALIRQFRYGSHHSAAFRSDSRIPPIQHQSRAKTCGGPLVTGRTSSASFMRNSLELDHLEGDPVRTIHSTPSTNIWLVRPVAPFLWGRPMISGAIRSQAAALSTIRSKTPMAASRKAALNLIKRVPGIPGVHTTWTRPQCLPAWWRSLFECLDDPRRLGMLLRPGRQLAPTHGAQLTA